MGESNALGTLVSTGQYIKPFGKQVEFPGRPIGVVWWKPGLAVARTGAGIVLIDAKLAAVRQSLNGTGGASMHGLAVAPDGTLWTSTAGSQVLVAELGADGMAKWLEPIELPKPGIGGDAYPCGITFDAGSQRAWVCLSRSNAVAEIDTKSRKVVRVIGVDIAPYGAVLDVKRNHLLVSCLGGVAPKEGARHADSSGTETEVEDNGVAAAGSVAIVDLASGAKVASATTGLLPTELALSTDSSRAFVANANSDTVQAFDLATNQITDTLQLRDGSRTPVDFAPNALSFDGDKLLVAMAGHNALAVLETSPKLRVKGMVPVGWYPGSVAVSAGRVAVANVKGIGSRQEPTSPNARSVGNFRGSVSLIELPSDADLSKWTSVAIRSATPFYLRPEIQKREVQPRPVPERLGEPSTFDHVIYVIKENRTYDELFGDLPNAEGESRLLLFGEDVIPNHRNLAREYVLLDNFYCNGAISTDGHAWATESNATLYLEKSFGGWTRSYPFGDDPLAYTGTGFIWDNVMKGGLSFWNFGEMVYSEPKHCANRFKDIYDAMKSGVEPLWKQACGVERVWSRTQRDYPGWNMNIPDQIRADVFIREFKRWDDKGAVPNLTVVYLPQDHTSGASSGMPKPRAHLADNDLALGRIVEAVSASKAWAKTCIFVVEDDPQAGFDHVDGHRSICLVVSPYSKLHKTVDAFHNQTSVIATMLRILGRPSQTPFDANSTLMTTCFGSRPDLSPYRATTPKTKLDEYNGQAEILSGPAKSAARISDAMNWSVPDLVDEAKLSRITWQLVKGFNVPYPTELLHNGKKQRK